MQRRWELERVVSVSLPDKLFMEHNSQANTGCMVIMVVMLIMHSWCVGLCTGCLEEEKYALLQIRDSVVYQPESILSSWLSEDDDCCQWDGVDCNPSTSHVARILLDYAREEDQLPWSPDLRLFAQLPDLLELHLPGNKISGLVNPEALCGLPKLQQLDLSDNSIEGEVHPCWGNMPGLRSLKLSMNQFRGNLSTIVRNLTIIETIDVSYNHFEGTLLFSTFADLPRLTYLDLSYNREIQVETETPANWQPSFQLQHLFLAGCKLNHQRKYRIPSFLSTQKTLQSLDLSGNFLAGSVPIWMLYNVSFSLRLRNNMFGGEFPHGYRTDAVASPLRELDLSCNYFEGPLPLNINTHFPNLYRFNISSNGMNGTIPPTLGELTNLQHLDLSNNRLVGKIPRTLTENSSLWYLNLSNNSLQGELLPQDCNMKHLMWLLLHDNHFLGSMPTCLSNCRSLMLLDARNNFLQGSLSKLPIFPQLGALLLRGNQIEGYIPNQLCRMERIQFLDLSKNNLSGNIPSCLKENLVWREKHPSSSWVPIDFTTKFNSYSYQGLPLTLMTGIDLSTNLLSGIIPSEIGELQQLCSLNLSQNLLAGHLPRSFGSLKALESLDLSHNKLSGTIPLEIAEMDSLGTFSVAFNQLSGKIPFVQHLCTFPERSYIGNPNLCGEPLPRKCSNEDQHQDHDDDDDDINGEEGHAEENGIIDEPLFFYSCVAMSYALGFWSFFAPLVFSRNWRRIYFAAVDGWIDQFLQRVYVVRYTLLRIYRN